MDTKKLTHEDPLEKHFGTDHALDDLYRNIPTMKATGNPVVIDGRNYKLRFSGMGKGLLQYEFNGIYRTLTDLPGLANFLRDQGVILPDWLAVWATPREANPDYQLLVDNIISEEERMLKMTTRKMESLIDQITAAKAMEDWVQVREITHTLSDIFVDYEFYKTRLELLQFIKAKAEKQGGK